MRARIVMPILSVLAALMTTLVVAVVATPSTASAATHRSARVQVRAVAASYDSQVLWWTNVARRQHGVAPLRAGACVDRFAEHWTVRMAARDSFRHQGLRPILRRCHRHAAAENIAYGGGSMSPSQVVQMWMHSPGHRRNLLNPRYKALGVGTWRSASTGRLYVTQDFAG